MTFFLKKNFTSLNKVTKKSSNYQTKKFPFPKKVRELKHKCNCPIPLSRTPDQDTFQWRWKKFSFLLVFSFLPSLFFSSCVWTQQRRQNERSKKIMFVPIRRHIPLLAVPSSSEFFSFKPCFVTKTHEFYFHFLHLQMCLLDTHHKSSFCTAQKNVTTRRKCVACMQQQTAKKTQEGNIIIN